MTPQENRKKQSVIQQVQAKGGIVTELRSVHKLATGEKSFSMFSGAESVGSYAHLAKYNFGGKSPISANSGTLLAYQFQLFGADFAPLDLRAGATPYLVWTEATKLLHQLSYEIKKNKVTLREGFVKSLHEPLPMILKPYITGAGVTDSTTAVTAVAQETGNIEHKSSKHALYLPIKIEGTGDTTEFNMSLPSGASGYSVAAALNDHLLALDILAVEYPR